MPFAEGMIIDRVSAVLGYSKMMMLYLVSKDSATQSCSVPFRSTNPTEAGARIFLPIGNILPKK